ncbi:MAG: hypothetical protein BGO69_04020 [Bacteroidetes bacterium 46-16]|nr:MAG: hypothetical protein BGO69_04020 [Bacteroidetes bacterium 46-16]
MCYQALPFSELDKTVPNLPHDYPKDPRTLGEHLRKRRYDLKLTRRDVGRIFKVHPGVIMHWENDHNEPSGCYEGLIRLFLGYKPPLT